MVVETKSTLNRRSVVSRILKSNNDVLVISGLGSPTYDVHAQGDRDTNFYLWGAMGSAALMGLGLALAQPKKRVLVITGDGEQLMGMGGLATISAQNPPNLSIVVLDNGHFGETGMQRSHTSLGVDLVGVAQSCGIPRCNNVWNPAGVDDLAENLFSKTGATFSAIHVVAQNGPRSLPTTDGVFMKNRIRQKLGISD